MNELTPTQRRALRATAHHLNPVVGIAGNGLTDAVLKEITVALKAHELIKVKLYGIERAERDELLAEICTRTGCAPVQHIGNILVLWLENPDRDRPAARNAPAAKKPTKKQAAAAAERPRRRQTARAR